MFRERRSAEHKVRSIEVQGGLNIEVEGGRNIEVQGGDCRICGEDSHVTLQWRWGHRLVTTGCGTVAGGDS